MPAVYVIATCDTKGAELDYVTGLLRHQQIEVLTVDVGTLTASTTETDVDRETVAACHPDGNSVLELRDRGAAVTMMSVALEHWLVEQHAQGRVAGVLGLGGSGGTALISRAMRALPIGLPKLLVSTVAAGNVGAYVDCSDIIMFPAVVDLAGMNSVSYRILANAAHAMLGMVSHTQSTIAVTQPTIAMTMFGVTTPCVMAVRTILEQAGFNCLVFHAVGTGGRTMEQLVAAGMVQGVLDLTTTEVADELAGGVFPAGAKRFEALINAGIPYVVSVGALDMVNFGAPETVPERYSGRTFHRHNSQVTLMRTTVAENTACAAWIAAKLNRGTSPWTLLIPEQGVSALDASGQPFHDPAADAALFHEFEHALQLSPQRQLLRLPLHINDPQFAERAAHEFMKLWNVTK